MLDLVGRKEVKDFTEKILENGDVYRIGGARLPGVCMNIGPGKGQSAVVRYISDKLYDNDIIKMRGLDRVLEFRPDTTTASLIEIENAIKDAAVYTNTYEGIVAIDISAVADSDDTVLQERLLKIITDIARNSMAIIFIDEYISDYKSRVMSAIGRCIDLRVKPLTAAELAEITMISVESHNISTEYREELTDFLHVVIARSCITTAKQAEEFSEAILFCCDYSSRTVDMGKVYSSFEGGKRNEK